MEQKKMKQRLFIAVAAMTLAMTPAAFAQGQTGGSPSGAGAQTQTPEQGAGTTTRPPTSQGSQGAPGTSQGTTGSSSQGGYGAAQGANTQVTDAQLRAYAAARAELESIKSSGRTVSDVQKTAALRTHGIDQATFDRIGKAAQQDRALQQRLASLNADEAPASAAPRTRQ